MTDVNIELITVTCDECEMQLTLEVNVSLYDVRQLSVSIKAAGWAASANCGHILCPECQSDWSNDE